MLTQEKDKKILLLVIITISSILGIVFLSGCSEYFLWYMPDDKDIFLTIGKYWTTGQAIPYIDLFDHKGPIIFFINALGYLIGKGQMYGVAILEILFLIVSELFAYKILRFKFDYVPSLILAALMPILFVYNFVPGNFTEEYMLPFLFVSFYLCLKYQKSNNIDHNPLYALVYGLSFGFALMTRVTNALSICLIVLLIIIILIKNKRWNNLLKNAIYFIIGTSIMVIPFCIYFYSKDALYDMWYATLLYNFDYTSNSGLTYEFTIKDIILLIRMTFPGIVAILVTLYRTIIERNKDSLFWLLVALPSTGFMYCLDRFANYSLVLVPFLYISLITIMVNNSKIENILIMFLLVFLILSTILKIRKLCVEKNKRNIDIGREYTELLKEIPKYELCNHFIIYDPPVLDMYLYENIKPCVKYFILQTWQSSNSNSLKELELNEFENNKNIHYLMCCGDGSMISEILKNDFVLIDKISQYNLYKRVK